MRNIFGNIPLPLHLLLLTLSIVLRLPSFHADYIQVDEALYGICAQKWITGNELYNNIWLSGPPVMVWFYGFFVAVFGSWWLWAIRIFTILYIYFLAIYFGGWMAAYRPFERFPALPPILMVILCASPWFALELNVEILLLLPLMIAYRAIIQVNEQKIYSFQSFFIAGALMAFCIWISFISAILVLSVFVLYLVLRRAAIQELSALAGGFGVVLGLGLLILFFSGSLGGFLDMTILYGFDLLRYEMFNETFRQIQGSLLSFLAVEAVFSGLALFGFFRFRIKYYNMLVKIRRLETGMAIWLVAGFTSLFLSVSRTQLHEWLLIAPPLAFYATKAFDVRLKKWMYMPLLLLSFLPTMWIYIDYWTSDFSKQSTQTTPIFQNKALVQYFKGKNTGKGIWVMDFKPEIYIALNQPCAPKYVDFRIAYQKFHRLPYASTHFLVSKVESDAAAFEEFQENLPSYILEPITNKNKPELFPRIKDLYPVLFFNYKTDIVGGYKIYHK